MKREVISATVYCHGIKPRCRKSETHRFSLGDFSPEADISEISLKAIETVKQGMKTISNGSLVRLILNKETLENDNGMTIRSFYIGVMGHKNVIDLTGQFYASKI